MVVLPNVWNVIWPYFSWNLKSRSALKFAFFCFCTWEYKSEVNLRLVFHCYFSFIVFMCNSYTLMSYSCKTNLVFWITKYLLDDLLISQLRGWLSYSDLCNALKFSFRNDLSELNEPLLPHSALFEEMNHWELGEDFYYFLHWLPSRDLVVVFSAVPIIRKPKRTVR